VCCASESVHVWCSASTLFILQWFAVLLHVFFTLAFFVGHFLFGCGFVCFVLGWGLGVFFQQKRLAMQMCAMILLA